MSEQVAHKAPPVMGGLKTNNLVQAWLVLFLAVVFGGLLAAVQVSLSDRIQDNKQNETLEKVPELIWGVDAARLADQDQSEIRIFPATVGIEAGTQIRTYLVFKVVQGAKLAGWVVKAGGQGYADKIELLIGLTAEADKISGLFVLEQKETPGLGNKISDSGWRRQYIGKSTAQPLAVIKGEKTTAENGIDAITGATISSRAVTDIINRAVRDVKAKLLSGQLEIQQKES